MTNKVVAIQGNHPSKLNPLTDTSIFLANEIQKQNNNNFKKEIIPTNEKFTKPKLFVFDTLSQEINNIVTSIISDLKKGFKRTSHM